MNKGSLVTIASEPGGKTGLITKTGVNLAINESNSSPFNQLEVCEILWSDGSIGWLPSNRLLILNLDVKTDK